MNTGCVIHSFMLPIQHMFPLYIHAECMQMLHGGGARGLAALSLGWWGGARGLGGALRIPRQCVVISGHSCQTVPLVDPFSPRTCADTLTCTHSLPSAHLHKVNLFTVIFGEWFALIGCADEGQSLWGAVTVFGDLILFQTLCLQLRKANVIPKPQKWKFVWTY